MLRPAAIIALNHLFRTTGCTERTIARAIGAKHAIVLLLELRDLGLVHCLAKRWMISAGGVEALRTGSVK